MLSSATVNLILFQIVWLISAVGAAHDSSRPALFAVSALVALHVRWAIHRCRAAATAFAAGVLGFTAESLLVATGVVRYAAAWPSEVIAPSWIVALWMAFGTTIEQTRHMLGHYAAIKALLLGAVLGPLSYLAGERLGALSLQQTPSLTFLALAAVWCVAYPVLIVVNHKLDDATAHGRHR